MKNLYVLQGNTITSRAFVGTFIIASENSHLKLSNGVGKRGLQFGKTGDLYPYSSCEGNT